MEEDYDRFQLMRNMFVADKDIKLKMKLKGYRDNEIEAFFRGERIIRQPNNAKKNSVNNSNVGNNSKAQAKASLPVKPQLQPAINSSVPAKLKAVLESKSLGRFIFMRKMNTPEEKIKDKMLIAGFTKEEIDAFLIQYSESESLTTKVIQNSLLQTEPKSPTPTHTPSVSVKKPTNPVIVEAENIIKEYVTIRKVKYDAPEEETEPLDMSIFLDLLTEFLSDEVLRYKMDSVGFSVDEIDDILLNKGIKGNKSARTGGGNTPYKSKKSHKYSTNTTLTSTRDSDDSSISPTASTKNYVSITSKTLKSENNNKVDTHLISDNTHSSTFDYDNPSPTRLNTLNSTPSFFRNPTYSTKSKKYSLTPRLGDNDDKNDCKNMTQTTEIPLQPISHYESVSTTKYNINNQSSRKSIRNNMDFGNTSAADTNNKNIIKSSEEIDNQNIKKPETNKIPNLNSKSQPPIINMPPPVPYITPPSKTIKSGNFFTRIANGFGLFSNDRNSNSSNNQQHTMNSRENSITNRQSLSRQNDDILYNMKRKLSQTTIGVSNTVNSSNATEDELKEKHEGLKSVHFSTINRVAFVQGNNSLNLANNANRRSLAHNNVNSVNNGSNDTQKTFSLFNRNVNQDRNSSSTGRSSGTSITDSTTKIKTFAINEHEFYKRNEDMTMKNDLSLNISPQKISSSRGSRTPKTPGVGRNPVCRRGSNIQEVGLI